MMDCKKIQRNSVFLLRVADFLALLDIRVVLLNDPKYKWEIIIIACISLAAWVFLEVAMEDPMEE